METRVIQVETADEVAPAAAEGARAILAGGLVAFPTETVYGIAVDVTHAAALERLRELKDRPSRPFTVHLGSPDDAKRYVREIPAAARRIMHKAWPGPITLLLPVEGDLPDDALQAAGLKERLVSEGVIGLRCPHDAVASAMLRAVPHPVVAPSANLAGQPSPRSGTDVLLQLHGRVDLLLDAGPTQYGTDSTIVLFDRTGAWRIVREGVLDEPSLRKLLRYTAVFVCTGNTCRSPMAAGIARHVLAERHGVRESELPSVGVEALSAGVFATDGAPASPEAVRAARTYGADISRHRSRRLTAELIHRADVVFCMTEAHVDAVLRIAPEAQGKVRRLGSEDVDDPIGGGLPEYQRIAAQIRQALDAALDEGPG